MSGYHREVQLATFGPLLAYGGYRKKLALIDARGLAITRHGSPPILAGSPYL